VRTESISSVAPTASAPTSSNAPVAPTRPTAAAPRLESTVPAVPAFVTEVSDLVAIPAAAVEGPAIPASRAADGTSPAPAPAPQSAPSGAAGGVAQTGFGFFLLFLALLTGLAAVARSASSSRALELPANWRPAPYLALLERPG